MATLRDYAALLWPRREARWSIGIYAGADPLSLSPHPALGEAPIFGPGALHGVRAAGVADPFMVRHGAAWHMFFEVENRDSGRGEIGLATSGDALRWRFDGIVLREPFHLSYPHVIEHEGCHYMVPESQAAGGVRLYRAARFPDRWELDAQLVAGDLADATLFAHEGRWWMIALEGFGQANAMVVYFADDLRGPWRAHAGNPVGRGLQQARPAGRVIRWQDRLVRFAQDDTPHYGRAVRAFHIRELSPERYVEEPLQAGRDILGPGKAPWNSSGMHHLDAHRIDSGEWIASVDGRRTVWRLPLLARLRARVGHG